MKKHTLLLLCLIAGAPVYAQWLDAKFPYGGAVTSILKNGDHLFAGTTNNLYQSDDKGTNWKVNRDIPVESFKCFALQNKVVYTGTSNGVYKTTDNGQTWVHLGTNGLTSPHIETLALRNNTLIVGTSMGIFLSTDDGTSWKATTPISSFQVIQSMVVSGNSIFASVLSKGIYRTTDDGKSWKRVDSASVPIGIVPLSMAAVNDTVYAATISGLYTSVDTGGTWKKLPPIPNVNVYYAIQTAGNRLYTCTDTGLFYSSDKGITWTALNNGLPLNQDCYQLAIEQNELFLATAKGVFFSANSGNSWVKINNGLTLKTLTTLSTVGNKLLASCWDQDGNFFFENNTWNPIQGIDSSHAIIDVKVRNSDVFALSYFDNLLFVSSDNGVTWNQKAIPVNGSAICATVTKLFVGGDNQLYQSTNDGASWQQVVNPLFASPPFYSMVSSGSSVYLGNGSKLIYSNNNGASWNEPVQTTSGLIMTLFANNDRIFAGTAINMYYSDDWGENWQTPIGLPPDVLIQGFAAKGNVIFAVCRTNGVFVSFDNGTHWQLITDDLIRKAGRAIAILDDHVYVALENGGVWYRKINEIISVKEYDARSSYTIYPNPTTGIFTLKGLPSSTLVNITDITGKQVYSTVINHPEEQIDLGRWEKGLYFISVINKQGVCENKKIILQ